MVPTGTPGERSQASGLRPGTGFRTLAESQKVEYTASQGPKGPQADQVHAL